MQSPESRKLKAVVFTDVEGYTSIMQRDEQKAITTIENHKKILERLVPTFQGEILNFYGDGALVIFDSAILAVEACKALQLAFLKQPKIPVRIGIHIGDILFRGNEFYGDGVNIASRIQSQGVAGSVLLSEDVYQKVKNQSGLTFRKIGWFDLKNVSQKVRIYALSGAGIVIPPVQSPPVKNIKFRKWILTIIVLAVLIASLFFSGYFKKDNQPIDHLTQFTPTLKSLAVLPFIDSNEDPDQAFFVEGMHESLIYDLSKIKSLKVISRTSMNRYKATQMSILEIAGELNVDAIIEGSVLKIGNTVRITVQLIDGNTDHHIWAQKYDRNLENILIMMSDVTHDIAQQVEIVVSPQEEELLKADKVNPQAHEMLMRAQYKMKDFTPVGFEEALVYINQAIEIDPNYAQAWAQKGMVKVLMALFSVKPVHELLPEAYKEIERAMNINANLSESYTALGYYNLLKWQWVEAGDAFRKALDINQNDAGALHGLSDYLTLSDRADEGLKLVKRSAKLDPFSPIYSIPLISHLCMNHQFDEALAKLKTFQELHPDYPVNSLLFKIHWHKKEYEKSIEFGRILVGNDSLLLNALESGYHDGDPFKALRSMAKAMEQRYNTGNLGNTANIAGVYAQIQDKEKTLEWLEKSLEIQIPTLYHIFLRPEYDFLRPDTKFIRLLNKMNLPINNS